MSGEYGAAACEECGALHEIGRGVAHDSAAAAEVAQQDGWHRDGNAVWCLDCGPAVNLSGRAVEDLGASPAQGARPSAVGPVCGGGAAPGPATPTPGGAL